MAQMTKIEGQARITSDPAKVFDFLKSDDITTQITKRPATLDNYNGAFIKSRYYYRPEHNTAPVGRANTARKHNVPNPPETDKKSNGWGPYTAPDGRPYMAGKHYVPGVGPNMGSVRPRDLDSVVTKTPKKMAHEHDPIQMIIADDEVKLDVHVKNRQAGGGVKKFELFVFDENLTVKLKPEVIDDQTRSISFSMVQEDSKKRNTAYMIRLTVKNNTIEYNIQSVGVVDASPDVTNEAKKSIDLIISALDGYLKSA